MSLSEKDNNKPRILVAPLDWGLGHTTRCIPIIHQLLQQGAEPVLAGDETQQAILSAEFPGLLFISLQGYRARYAATKWGMFWQMCTQSNKFFNTINHENTWLQKIIATYKIEAVISDNRFGLYSSTIPSVFITHQLTIKSFLGKWTERWLQRLNYKYINRYSECWIPDWNGEGSLAATLSHPEKMPSVPVKYIGAISRFEKLSVAEQSNHLLIIISGPEPQRTIFENIILSQLKNHAGTATVVRGLPSEKVLIPSTTTITFHNHLSALLLNEEMIKASMVISRCGYSTVMDLAALGKKSILVPTPGQTEQEYLATQLNKNKQAHIVLQNQFDLVKATTDVLQNNYSLLSRTADCELQKAVEQFIATIRQ